MKQKLKICLTGGIASGKTYVSDRLYELGASVIDADVLSREVVARGSIGLREVVAAFGESVLQDDETLNRSVLKSMVFSDKTKLKTLNDILHPLIRHAFAAHSKANTKPIEIWVIPLFYGGDNYQGFDRVLVVDVPETIQIERVQSRDKVSTEIAEQIIAAQPSRTDRLNLATDVINNRFSLKKLEFNVTQLHLFYQELLRNNYPAIK